MRNELSAASELLRVDPQESNAFCGSQTFNPQDIAAKAKIGQNRW